MRFEMSEVQCAKLMEACKPVPLIMLQCGTPTSAQESANRAWQALGLELGFKWDTARPYPSEGPRVFTAEPLAAKEESKH